MHYNCTNEQLSVGQQKFTTSQSIIVVIHIHGYDITAVDNCLPKISQSVQPVKLYATVYTCVECVFGGRKS